MTHAFTTIAAGPELALMHRYETRQTRLFQHALHNLLMLLASTPGRGSIIVNSGGNQSA
jgi:hypothetical protein